MSRKRLQMLASVFTVPALIILGIAGYSILFFQFHEVFWANAVIFLVIFIGSIELIWDTFIAIIHKKFALDYIAILAISTGLITGHYLVSAVIALMLAGGTGLEKYGTMLARRSLTALTNRIPHEVLLWADGAPGNKIPIETVTVSQTIMVRRGEVVPLDGILVSKGGYLDESSLTGEPYMYDKVAGDIIRSGTVNAGDTIVVRVTREDRDSTYRKIIDMVVRAQSEKSPLIRLADQYSTFFTFITLVLCAIAYLLSHDLTRVLAVLVVATPCPLILATPIALMGGMNAAAKKRIILKRLSAIEVLSRVRALILDKTGTLTLGKPTVTEIKIVHKSMTPEKAIRIACAIERNSLHPMAKAIVSRAKEMHEDLLPARDVTETVGSGIRGTVGGKTYVLRRASAGEGMTIELLAESTTLAMFLFEDELKKGAARILRKLVSRGLRLSLYTGDKESRARKTVSELNMDIDIKAECTPEDKQRGIATLKKQGFVTAMVGDGINDAPALARADVGLVFSNEEQTASSEAADVVFLGGDLELLSLALALAKRTVGIALESIWVGMGLSVAGMIAAAAGFLPPIWGAIGQEFIDVAVILNALRASRFKHA